VSVRAVETRNSEASPSLYWRPSALKVAKVDRPPEHKAAAAPKLAKPISAYLRENFHYTTSGMAWTPPVMYVHQVMGAERLLYAMDYPYQYVAEEVLELDNLPLDAAGKHRFFQGNAERLFSL